MIDNIENVLINGNLRYQWKILQGLENIEVNDKIPKYPVLILTCMDPRIDVHRVFQLNPGDVFILRNAGNLITSDALRSILLAVYQYNIKHIIILGHLDCGMTKIKMLELRKKIPYEFFTPRSKESLDIFSQIKNFFKPFTDELKNIKQQLANIKRLRVHKEDLTITGMLYDVDTGWVFEYEKFQEFDNIENFREQFSIILNEKKFQSVEFIKSIENEIVSNKESVEDQYILPQQESHDDEKIIFVGNLEEDETFNAKINHETISNRLFTTQMILPKISFPQIHFSRVKIYMPKISRNNK